MSSGREPIDRSDPAARALARREGLRARDQTARIATTIALGALATALPLTAGPLTGSPGATVGAVVAALLCLAVVAAIWPAEWAPEEFEHHRLDSIWRELRSDADRFVPWERYAAWAESANGSVAIGLLQLIPVETLVAGAPSPYRWSVSRRLGADDIAAAAEVMEALRERPRSKVAAGSPLAAHRLREEGDGEGLVLGGRAGIRLRRRGAPRARRVGGQEARPNRPPRVPPHLRGLHDRRRRERQGALDRHGHSSITITLDRYGHLMPESEREAAGMLEAYLDREAG